ncbi:uncharacterized protein LOC128251821 [Drosophila gunungcola]|uniref:uncharacterized protein LOC128251821 n=1 Tax=Drosophila gunungcola TaxID=103775 RepID=UPI0022E810BB|nr:uncharacterized protein LOC128251821 [Drosophila gunungcola]
MKFAFVVGLMWAFSVLVTGGIVTRHTNIKCEIHDQSFAEVKVCRLKVLGRGIIGANVHFKILSLPIKTILINFSVFKKMSGYHPFLFNITADLCHYMKHPNPSNVFFYFYRALTPFINVNHTCPINVRLHDVILKDFVLDDKMFSIVPAPVGSYMFLIKLIANGALRATIYSYLDINVDKP